MAVNVTLTNPLFHDKMYWHTSQYNSQYLIPSIIPSSQSMNLSFDSFTSQIMYSPSTFQIYLFSIPTLPLSHCLHCTPTYICPHHFKESPLAQFFCCHYCYILHTYPRDSPRRRQFYSS